MLVEQDLEGFSGFSAVFLRKLCGQIPQRAENVRGERRGVQWELTLIGWNS